VEQAAERACLLSSLKTTKKDTISKLEHSQTQQKTKQISKTKPLEEMSSEKESCDVGLFGLAVMGQNFALNMASHGFSVVVGNRSPAKVTVTVDRAKAEGNLPLTGSTDAEDMVSKLKKPRKIVILVMAGKPVDDTIANLAQYLEPGDLIVDGGNEWYENSIRRAKELEQRGILFMGMGISGGEEGAREGPSLMPGSQRKAYDLMEPILLKCAAQVDDGACTGYIGPVGSGNYVKMIHNGIEYGDMQLIAEVYDVLSKIVGMSNEEMSRQFARWNDGVLSSYLIEITAKILNKPDDVTGNGYVVDYVS
jgi:6-phosphogluconate dehydrogenase